MTNQYTTGGEGAPLWQEFGAGTANPGAKDEGLAAALKEALASELGPLRQQVAAIQAEVRAVKAAGAQIPSGLQDRLDTLLDQIEGDAEEKKLAAMSTEEQLTYLKEQARTRAAGNDESGLSEADLLARRDTEYGGFVLPSLRAFVEAQGLLLTPEFQTWLERADTPAGVKADGTIDWDAWMSVKRAEIKAVGDRVRANAQAAQQDTQDSPARQAGGALGSPTRPAAPGGGGRPDFFKSDFDTLFDAAIAQRSAATAGRR